MAAELKTWQQWKNGEAFPKKANMGVEITQPTQAPFRTRPPDAYGYILLFNTAA